MTKENLQRSLEQEAQQIEERMPMTAKETARIADRLKRLMTERKLSNAQIARALGVSSSKISQFLNHKYKGDLETLANQVVNYINSVTRKERQRGDKPKFVQTTVAREIGTMIANTESFSEDEGRIGMIIGDGGHGKSFCLRAYAQTNKNTIYVELDDCMGPRTIFGSIAAKVGLESYGTLDSIARRLVDNLEHRHVVVILDECSGLSVGVLNKLRQVITVKCRCPLILAGNHGLRDTINQPTTRRGHESLDQFTSRLFQILDLDRESNNKGRGGELYTTEDIRKLYEYGGVRLVNGAARVLKDICRTPRSGRLRTCSLIIEALHTVKGCQQITPQLLIDTVATLGLPVQIRLPFMITETAEDEHLAEAKTAG